MGSYQLQAQQSAVPAERAAVLELLCHSWVASHFVMQGKKMPIPPEEGETMLTFSADGIYTEMIMGASQQGNYQYDHRTRVIKISTEGPRDQMKIMSINSSEMQLDMMDPEYPGLFVMKRKNKSPEKK